jgi:hypothetical protein
MKRSYTPTDVMIDSLLDFLIERRRKRLEREAQESAPQPYVTEPKTA